MSDHWSIGEVLSLLQEDFPEVTISKIRFLESQGLISPERTPSGYRRFYQDDFDRLRWILEQQRDHYLPLKVIRRRLESGEFEAEQQQLDVAPTSVESRREVDVEGEDPEAEPAPAGTPLAETGLTETPSMETPSMDTQVAASDRADAEFAEAEPMLAGVGSSGAQTSVRSSDRRRPSTEPDGDVNVALTREELVEASGCDATLLTDLERYGIVAGRTIGPTVLYDREALEIARLASRFAAHGLDARHLRTLRIGAEREVGLIFQIVEPMLHRRRPEGQRESIETLDELVAMATALRTIFIDQLVREQLPNPRG